MATKTAKRGSQTAKRSPHSNSHGRRKWSAEVKTESTYPEQGLFNEDAETIARKLASKKVSPKGTSSGMRMLTFYINRAGKNLSASRRRELERAKGLLHKRIEAAKRRASR
jgi:hypothetical protein